MRHSALLLGVVVGLLVCIIANADIPKVINFQGRLTDASGKFVPDGNYSLTFRIYTDSSGGSTKWSEGQLVFVSKGLFNVILGSVTPIPDSIFNYPNTWLGLQVGADPEMAPRQRLSSLGYAYRGAKADTSSYSLNSDRLDGYDASDFTSPASDYGRSGVATDLYEGTTTLTDKYVNESQANSISSGMITDNQIVDADISASANISPSKISGTAWTSNNDGAGSGLDADLLDGQNSSAFLSTSSDYGRSGVATNLYEGDSTLTSRYVNEGQANSVTSSMITNGEIVDADISASANITPSKISGTAWTSNNDGAGSGLDADLLDGQQASAFITPSSDYGRSGVATDLYEGTSTLTSKYVNMAGPDSVVSTSTRAFLVRVNTDTTSTTHGLRGYANNSSSGVTYAGYFTTYSSGTGIHYGLRGDADGSSTSPTYGMYGDAGNSSTGTSYGVYGTGQNTSSGIAYGGYFITSSAGTGNHYGVRGFGYGSSTTSTFGVSGYAENTSSGTTCAGSFSTSSEGTGDHYGVTASGYGASSSDVFGIYTYASNSLDGNAYGGYFSTASLGTGKHYGIRADGIGTSDSNTYGSYGYAQNSSTGYIYGGYFETNAVGSGNHYGVRGIGRGASTPTTFGIVGSADNTSSGSAWGGQFYTTISGTGDHYGIWTQGAGSSSATTTYGIYSDAYNTSTATVYAGYFYAEDDGTGTKYGIRSYASAAEGYAGYFVGNTTTTGTKSAAVKVENGEYRMLYCQESPENWFEDFGEGQMVNGKTHIELDPLFLQTVTIDAQNPMKVFIQLRDDCKGTYVKTYTTGFDIFELQGGTSNAAFSYRVVAKRKGYENIRLAKMMGQTPEEMKAEQEQRRAEMEKEINSTSMKEERQEPKQEEPPVIEETEEVKK